MMQTAHACSSVATFAHGERNLVRTADACNTRAATGQAVATCGESKELTSWCMSHVRVARCARNILAGFQHPDSQIKSSKRLSSNMHESINRSGA
eukprot:6189383-Pleurochrysis_carterae.AAC.1